MSKATLTRLIKVMFLCLMLAFAYVLIRSISGPSKLTAPINAFDDVVIGQTAARRVGSQRVWVTRLSPAHRSQLSELSPYVSDASSGCAVNTDVCVLLAATARSGIDIIYSLSAPAQLPANVPWFGGFVNPITGEMFDRLGRAYAVNASERSHLPQWRD